MINLYHLTAAVEAPEETLFLSVKEITSCEWILFHIPTSPAEIGMFLWTTKLLAGVTEDPVGSVFCSTDILWPYHLKEKENYKKLNSSRSSSFRTHCSVLYSTALTHTSVMERDITL